MPRMELLGPLVPPKSDPDGLELLTKLKPDVGVSRVAPSDEIFELASRDPAYLEEYLNQHDDFVSEVFYMDPPNDTRVIWGLFKASLCMLETEKRKRRLLEERMERLDDLVNLMGEPLRKCAQMKSLLDSARPSTAKPEPPIQPPKISNTLMSVGSPPIHFIVGKRPVSEPIDNTLMSVGSSPIRFIVGKRPVSKPTPEEEEDKKERRLEKKRENARKRLAKEDEYQREERRKKKRENARKRMAEEGEEERKERLKKRRELDRKRLEDEDEEAREERLKKQRERDRKRLGDENEEERDERLNKQRERDRKRLGDENEEEREERLKKQRERDRKRLAALDEGERAERLRKRREKERSRTGDDDEEERFPLFETENKQTVPLVQSDWVHQALPECSV